MVHLALTKEGGDEDGGDGEWVYDLYVADEEEGEEDGPGGAETRGMATGDECGEEGGWAVPITLLHDDALLMWEKGGDSDGGDEAGAGGDDDDDSNAEDFYGADYPDEEGEEEVEEAGSSGSAATATTSSDGWGGGGGGGHRHRRAVDPSLACEEFDLTVEDEEGFLDPTHRMRQEAAAWARQQRAEEGEGEESE